MVRGNCIVFGTFVHTAIIILHITTSFTIVWTLQKTAAADTVSHTSVLRSMWFHLTTVTLHYQLSYRLTPQKTFLQDLPPNDPLFEFV